MKNSHVMAWSSFTLAQTKDDIKKCEGKPAIMRTKAGFHYIEKWVSKSQKWKKSRKKENYANSIVQRFKTTNSLRFRKRSGCIQLTIGGILNHKMRKWMNKQKEKKSSSMTFCWRKVIENKGQHMEKGVETEKKHIQPNDNGKSSVWVWIIFFVEKKSKKRMFAQANREKRLALQHRWEPCRLKSNPIFNQIHFCFPPNGFHFRFMVSEKSESKYNSTIKQNNTKNTSSLADWFFGSRRTFCFFWE